MIHKPKALGLILCEQLIVEEKTQNLTPVNCFRRRKVAGFPSEPFPFVLLVLLTDGMGTMDLELIIQRLEDEEVVYRRVRRCRFPDPLQEVRGVFRIRHCSFPSAGVYEVSLLADGEPVAARRLYIQQEET